MKYLVRERVSATLRVAGSAAIAVCVASLPVFASGRQSVPAPQNPQATRSTVVPQPGQVTQPPVITQTLNQGIVYLTAPPDTLLTIKTGQGVVTRVSLPEEAKSAICGD